MISVVIPALDEAVRLPPLLAALGREESDAEILVVDGGSLDGTAQLARRLGARVLAAPRGRGHQLRAGADAARGDTLLFLHADSRFPAGGLRRVSETLAAAPSSAAATFACCSTATTRSAAGSAASMPSSAAAASTTAIPRSSYAARSTMRSAASGRSR